MKSLVVVLLSSLCIPFSATSQTFDVHNSLGLRMSVDTDDRNPALIIVVPDGPEGIRSSKILFPEHVTVRAHSQKEQEHLYIFRAGAQGYSPKWKKTDNALEYAHDFGQIHFVARATLKDDGIVFLYEFTNHSGIDYDIVTATRAFTASFTTRGWSELMFTTRMDSIFWRQRRRPD
jgi:hypothetical protein